METKKHSNYYARYFDDYYFHDSNYQWLISREYVVYRKTTFYASLKNTDLKEDHYAVLVAISDYSGSLNDLPSPTIKVKNIKEILCNKRWVADNMDLLMSGEAKRQGVLDALDWKS